ncbi:nucleotide exchange factor GrpE [Candidatus Epulonipiscium fishelsonii]|uniref:Nucleotide exchange factor GrpE n=1 Tax=Candidatus Epulonipiscium fishelsonii TaxID=77094 RepID=A0ACC8XGT3_9FIRM|nr:nucleotide exchange factor GrpE [Epulopiscium sp. SCG-B05WGA-EpuloA1]ONI42775.1 nucleotide exchange factor GrpE [Epulopiscium sp. SCG-B11WGA-EpuloA1]
MKKDKDASKTNEEIEKNTEEIEKTDSKIDENESTEKESEETTEKAASKNTKKTTEENSDKKDKEDKATKAEETDKSKEYIEKYQRLMADFENYRKRNDKEKLETYDRAVSNTVKELLTVIDNFERALKQKCEDKEFYDGVSMIYKQIFSALEKLGVEPIDAVDEEFDPNLHNAIFHVDDEKYGKNVIIEEMQKGYMFKGKVIRHSLVKVAN